MGESWSLDISEVMLVKHRHAVPGMSRVVLAMVKVVGADIVKRRLVISPEVATMEGSFQTSLALPLVARVSKEARRILLLSSLFFGVSKVVKHLSQLLLNECAQLRRVFVFMYVELARCWFQVVGDGRLFTHCDYLVDATLRIRASQVFLSQNEGKQAHHSLLRLQDKILISHDVKGIGAFREAIGHQNVEESLHDSSLLFHEPGPPFRELSMNLVIRLVPVAHSIG